MNIDEAVKRAAAQVGWHPNQVAQMIARVRWAPQRLLAEVETGAWLAGWWREVVEAEANRRACQVGPKGMWGLTDAQALALIAPPLRAAVERYDGGSALFLGRTGLGKTLAALLIQRTFVRHQVKQLLGTKPDSCPNFRWNEQSTGASWVEAIALAEAVKRHPLGEGLPPEMRDAKDAGLLVLDDIAWAPRDDATLEVIGYRYDTARPTVFTVGLSRSQLVERFGDAVVRRMLEVGGRKGFLVEV